MAEILCELVVALSQDSSNFLRNKQIWGWCGTEVG